MCIITVKQVHIFWDPDDSFHMCTSKFITYLQSLIMPMFNFGKQRWYSKREISLSINITLALHPHRKKTNLMSYWLPWSQGKKSLVCLVWWLWHNLYHHLYQLIHKETVIMNNYYYACQCVDSIKQPNVLTY